MDSPKSNHIAIVISIFALIASVAVPLLNQSRTRHASEKDAKRKYGMEALSQVNSELSVFPSALIACLNAESQFAYGIEQMVSDEEFYRRYEECDVKRQQLYDATVKMDAQSELVGLVFGNDGKATCSALRALTERAYQHFAPFDRPEVRSAEREIEIRNTWMNHRSAIEFCSPIEKDRAKHVQETSASVAVDVAQIKIAMKRLGDLIRAE